MRGKQVTWQEPTSQLRQGNYKCAKPSMGNYIPFTRDYRSTKGASPLKLRVTVNLDCLRFCVGDALKLDIVRMVSIICNHGLSCVVF